ncbi:helix-turn-helix domain-containing protein [Pectinatus cerevisiiphilus]
MFLHTIGGKWKMLILRGIEQKGFVRFNETKRVLSASGRILQTHLRELEGDGLIQRIDYPGYPRRTDYVFTEVGKTLIPIINSIYKWNIKRMKEQQIPITTETSIYHQDID